MKKEVADAWVAALRSGKYEQCKESLRYRDKYCCLGVLCDISKCGDWAHDMYMKQDEVLPTAVIAYADMRSASGHISIETSLAKLNDGGTSFTDIADIIEKEWENL